MPPVLKIAVTFPHGYGGGTLGVPEEVPSFARLHEAFVAAAAGGPGARADGRVLVADDGDRAAVRWLEDHAPIGVRVPEARLSSPAVSRYRWRASPVTLAGSSFEGRAAHDGPVTYYWPAPAPELADRLRTIAGEITHVGRADSIARVRVGIGDDLDDHGQLHEAVSGRGPGLVARIPSTGRFATLERAHLGASAGGAHGTGPLGKQAPDQMAAGANEDATVLRRFAPANEASDWPFVEVLRIPVVGSDTEHVTAKLSSDPALRVTGAVAVHRSLIRAIGEDVPPFITGRDGAGPLRGHGHLAIHLLPNVAEQRMDVLLGVPHDVDGADIDRLRAALAQVRPRIASRTARLGPWEREAATAFWNGSVGTWRVATPMVLDAPGTPKRGPWSLEDAVRCSVGYAFRGVLERAGFAWGGGWAFRRALVEHLRDELGVEVEARRVHRSASRYVHRAAPGDLLVAVDAAVRLGGLAAPNGGFVALGRARHLGGGLLVPAEEAR